MSRISWTVRRFGSTWYAGPKNQGNSHEESEFTCFSTGIDKLLRIARRATVQPHLITNGLAYKACGVRGCHFTGQARLHVRARILNRYINMMLAKSRMWNRTLDESTILFVSASVEQFFDIARFVRNDLSVSGLAKLLQWMHLVQIFR